MEPTVNNVSKPREQSRNWPAVVVVAAYAILMFLWNSLGWQHLGLIALAWACLTTLPGPRRFVRDWWPLMLFWLAYDVMRVFSGSLLNRAAVQSLFDWEAALFRAPDGTVWPFHFALWLERSGAAFWPHLLSRVCSQVYLSHLYLMPAIFLVLWLRRSDRLFRRLLWSFTALHALSLLIYLVYPAAPPWWVYQNGFRQPAPGFSMPRELASGSTLAALFQFNPNRFAAVPSLHGAYPMLLTLVLAYNGERSRWILFAGLYAACMWFACVFLNQHYIVDLLMGAAVVPIALILASPKLREVSGPRP